MAADTLIDPIAPWVTTRLAAHPEAHRFLDIVYRAIEVWDDIIDRDNGVTDNDVHAAFTSLLIELPFNGFFQANKVTLAPMLQMVISTWHASNAMPREGAHGAHGYVLRKEFINFCLMVIGMCVGPHVQHEATLEAWQATAASDSYEAYLKGN